MTPCAANSVERKIIQVLRRPAADGAPSRGLFRWILRLASSWAWGFGACHLYWLTVGVASVDRDWRLPGWVKVYYLLCSPPRILEGPTSEMGLGWMDGGRWWFAYWASEIMSCWVLLLRERRKNHDGWPCVGSCEIWGEMSDER